ncbi:MAG: hypothetical protein KGQ88_05300 [Chloroflexi bacterium]|nr:hypothetical protein [Chloroflexota bacterium]
MAYDGAADLIAVDGAGTPQVTRVEVSLRAELDPLHHTAEATLMSGSDRYHLVQPAPGKGGIDQILATFETALLADDWRTIYDLTTSDISANYTADAFVAQVASQRPTIGAVTGVKRMGVSEIRTNPAGMTFFVASYAVTRGSASSATYDVYFVRQADIWKLWFTARH